MFYRSRHFLTYFTISLLCVYLLWIFWYFKRAEFPPQIPFDFLQNFGKDQLVSATQLWRLPLYTTLSLIVTTILARQMDKKDVFYGQIILSSMTFISVIALLSFVRIVIIFT